MDARQGAEAVVEFRPDCPLCGSSRCVFHCTGDCTEARTLRRIVEVGRPMARGQCLYHAGAPFAALYTVRSGTVKTSAATEDGEERVIGFGFPGDIVGLDAIGGSTYLTDACVLETASVGVIPFARLQPLLSEVPTLQHRLLQAMSRQIAAEHEMRLALLKSTAEQRFAVGLVSLSRRCADRGLSPTILRLAMSQAELGSYLGLAPETVSRLFRRFREQGWLDGTGRECELLDIDAIRAVARRQRGVPSGSSGDETLGAVTAGRSSGGP